MLLVRFCVFRVQELDQGGQIDGHGQLARRRGYGRLDNGSHHDWLEVGRMSVMPFDRNRVPHRLLRASFRSHIDDHIRFRGLEVQESVRKSDATCRMLAHGTALHLADGRFRGAGAFESKIGGLPRDATKVYVIFSGEGVLSAWIWLIGRMVCYLSSILSSQPVCAVRYDRST